MLIANIVERSNRSHHHSTNNDHMEWEILPQPKVLKKDHRFGRSKLCQLKMVESRNHHSTPPWVPKETGCWYLPWPSSCHTVKVHNRSSSWRFRSKTSFPESAAGKDPDPRRLLWVQALSSSWMQVGHRRSIACRSFQDRRSIGFGGVVSWGGCASGSLSRCLFFRVILQQWPTICAKENNAKEFISTSRIIMEQILHSSGHEMINSFIDRTRDQRFAILWNQMSVWGEISKSFVLVSEFFMWFVDDIFFFFGVAPPFDVRAQVVHPSQSATLSTSS